MANVGGPVRRIDTVSPRGKLDPYMGTKIRFCPTRGVPQVWRHLGPTAAGSAYIFLVAFKGKVRLVDQVKLRDWLRTR